MSVLLAVVAACACVGATVAINVLSAEATASLPRLAAFLIKVAVRRLPPEHRARYEEEWSAEAAEYGERRLAAVIHAFRVAVSAAGLSRELPTGRERRSTDFRPRVDTLARGQARDGEGHGARSGARRRHVSAVGWAHVLSAMEDATLTDVDTQLDAAGASFARLLEPVQLRTPSISRTKTAGPVQSREAPAPASEGPYFAPAPVERPLRRRYGPRGAVDPEWRIAALTAKERQLAKSFVNRAPGQLGLLDEARAVLPPLAQRALLSAITERDERPRHSRRARRIQHDHQVRLRVFIEAWGLGHALDETGSDD